MGKQKDIPTLNQEQFFRKFIGYISDWVYLFSGMAMLAASPSRIIEGARPTVVEAAEGRLHISGWGCG